jgi:hypothetical protein
VEDNQFKKKIVIPAEAGTQLPQLLKKGARTPMHPCPRLQGLVRRFRGNDSFFFFETGNDLNARRNPLLPAHPPRPLSLLVFDFREDLSAISQ